MKSNLDFIDNFRNSGIKPIEMNIASKSPRKKAFFEE